MKKTFLISVYLLVCFMAKDVFALDVETHRAINSHIADPQFNVLLDQYLEKNVGLAQGLSETFNGNSVRVWLELGGEFEDKPPQNLIPYRRSRNHFLNPLNGSGYTGFGSLCDIGYCPTNALLWAKEPQVQNPFNPGGDWSWGAVRAHYLTALTALIKTERDAGFANTFRGVGQLMHLVEDMSVPAHTRNDGHILYNYEKWVDNTRIENPGVFNGLLSNPVYFSGVMSTYDPLFLDLATFSNANFLSNDTIFSGFTYPRIEDTELWTDTTNNRDYLRKLASSTGVQVDHLAASSWLYFYRLRYFPANNTLLPLGLDDKVYADYAQLLIPRAVGYSAGLINYFFRGQIDMKPDAENAGKYVIENFSNEDMSGAFSLYYDDENDNRNLVTSWNRSINAGGKSDPVEFTEPTDAKEKGKYMLVFSGALGSEAEAVAGKVVTLIPCPKPGLPSDIDIIGSDAPQNGSQYTASGGVEPYSWAITKGSITQNGVVTVSGQCGSATIAATDSCGAAGTKDVKMPKGTWALTHWVNICGAITCWDTSGSKWCIKGTIAIYKTWGVTSIPPGACGATADQCGNPPYAISVCDGSESYYEWRCQ